MPLLKFAAKHQWTLTMCYFWFCTGFPSRLISFLSILLHTLSLLSELERTLSFACLFLTLVSFTHWFQPRASSVRVRHNPFKYTLPNHNPNTNLQIHTSEATQEHNKKKLQNNNGESKRPYSPLWFYFSKQFHLFIFVIQLTSKRVKTVQVLMTRQTCFPLE